MDCNYDLFYVGLEGLTNQQVIDAIYMQMREYCELEDDDKTKYTMVYREKLRLLFDKAARTNPHNKFCL